MKVDLTLPQMWLRLTKERSVWIPLVVLSLCGAAMLFVGTRVNYTFIDEVYFAEPAVNVLHGEGYTSAVWNTASAYDPHVSSAPAYSMLLIPVFGAFGVSHFVMRTLASLLAVVAMLVLWRASVRAGLVTSARGAAFLLVVVLMSYGLAFSYSCGRPEALSLLLMALLFFAFTLKTRWLGLALVAAICVWFPFVQWALVIYAASLGGALLLLLGRPMLPWVAVAGVSMGAGLLIQKAVYLRLGIWDLWMSQLASESLGNVFERIAYRLSLAGLRDHTNVLPKDFSSWILIGGTAVILLLAIAFRQREVIRLARAGLVVAICAFSGLYFLGKFPTYYGWMLTVPLAVLLASVLDRLPVHEKVIRRAVVAVGGVAVLCGLPLQAAIASYNWSERDPSAFQAWIGDKVKPDDVVFCDYPLYFALKNRAARVYAGRYFVKLTPEERSRITLIVLSNHSSDWSREVAPLRQDEVVGEWIPARAGLLGNRGGFGILSQADYSATVYRPKHYQGPQ